MQKNYSIKIVYGIAVTRFFKKPDLPEIISAMDDLAARGEYRLRLWVLEDGIDLCNDEIAEMGRHGKQIWSAPSKTAAAASDDLSFGIMRVHEVYREHDRLETRVFRTEREALTWLKSKSDSKPNQPGQKDFQRGNLSDG